MARKRKVVGVVRSPYALPGQEVEVNGGDPVVKRYLANGVLEAISEAKADERKEVKAQEAAEQAREQAEQAEQENADDGPTPL